MHIFPSNFFINATSIILSSHLLLYLATLPSRNAAHPLFFHSLSIVATHPSTPNLSTSSQGFNAATQTPILQPALLHHRNPPLFATHPSSPHRAHFRSPIKKASSRWCEASEVCCEEWKMNAEAGWTQWIYAGRGGGPSCRVGPRGKVDVGGQAWWWMCGIRRDVVVEPLGLYPPVNVDDVWSEFTLQIFARFATGGVGIDGGTGGGEASLLLFLYFTPIILSWSLVIFFPFG